MDPNTNQPQRPQPGQIANNQPFTPPRPQPDWQQGLGNVQAPSQPQQYQTSAPQAQQQMPQTVPQSGELPTPTPVTAVQPQPAPWTPPTPPVPPRQSVMTPPSPSMGSGVPSSGGKKGLLRILGIIAVVIALALLGFGVYKFAQRSSNGSSGNASSAGAIDLATVDRVTMLPPDTISGFKSRQTGTANIKDYVADDNSCELIVGTTTAAQLPGADLNAIVQPQVEQLKKAGATVKGPSNGSALILKDMDDEKKTYTLPTVKYEFTQDKKHAVVHYSAVILKSGDRVVVNRTCINQNGNVDNNKITSLDTKAKDIQIMVDQKQ